MQEEDRLLRAVRHLILRAPLFMPLLGVVGCLLGGQWWALTVAVLLLAHSLKLWRLFICSLLCTGIAFLQADLQQRGRDELRDRLRQDGYVYLEGVIERICRTGRTSRTCPTRAAGEFFSMSFAKSS